MSEQIEPSERHVYPSFREASDAHIRTLPPTNGASVPYEVEVQFEDRDTPYIPCADGTRIYFRFDANEPLKAQGVRVSSSLPGNSWRSLNEPPSFTALNAAA